MSIREAAKSWKTCGVSWNMNPNKTQKLAVMLMCSLLMHGCISFSTFQSAQTLEKGTLNANVGLLTLLGEEGIAGAVPEAGFRLGVSDRMDVGVKALIPGIVLADIKLELIPGPVTLSFDLGYSLIAMGDTEEDRNTNRVAALYPMLLLGGETWYSGIKTMYVTTGGYLNSIGSSGYAVSNWILPAITVGRIHGGERARALLEMNIFFTGDRHEIILMPGLGIELTLY